MRSLFTLFVLFLVINASAQNASNYRTRVLLIPLDDRPPCLQFTQKMGLIGNAEVVSPPKELLGNFTTPGQPEKIIAWLNKQNFKMFNAAVISLDMLAYGGLVASRIHHTQLTPALSRIEVIKKIHQLAPHLPVYGQSVIMRLAPTGDGKNEAYRQKLADWAEISVAEDEVSKKRAAELVRDIPTEALTDYKASRKRNLSVNYKAIDFVRSGIIDYLILSQDDAKPRGIHVADREQLIERSKKFNLTSKILVMPGADEISMLLLSRALNKRFNFSPKIKAVYSSEELSNKAMPFEDRPLRQTVSYDIAAIGATEVIDAAKADLLFYVYPSRFETGNAQSFASEIEKQTDNGKHVIVADIDPKGDVQGGDPNFSTELLRRRLLPRLYSYASWNTAGNTIGTTLPQGVIYALAKAKMKQVGPKVSKQIELAEHWFTFHRVLDDYYYHTLVRGKAKTYIQDNKYNPLRLTLEETQKVESYCMSLLSINFKELSDSYTSNQVTAIGFKPSGMTFALPWGRTFEAEIDFKVH
ncbi:DUF4127 family protein [Mucilaginibacter sp. PAMB04168]|uniref:DUF4127 family protein n=1 Tax=Mucilaginibacter sp. PAMB04168 TaxID=3138567 RepID=UPI0031F6E382